MYEKGDAVSYITVIISVILFAILTADPVYALSMESGELSWCGPFGHHHPVNFPDPEVVFSYSSLESCHRWGNFMFDHDGFIKGIIEPGPITTLCTFWRHGFCYICPNGTAYHRFDLLNGGGIYFGCVDPGMIIESWDMSREHMLEFCGYFS